MKTFTVSIEKNGFKFSITVTGKSNSKWKDSITHGEHVVGVGHGHSSDRVTKAKAMSMLKRTCKSFFQYPDEVEQFLNSIK